MLASACLLLVNSRTARLKIGFAEWYNSRSYKGRYPKTFHDVEWITTPGAI